MTDYELIKKDRQIFKFSMYGLLKNLKFFEPYLIIFLLGIGYKLFEIGILYSIREIIVYIFEIPSGIIADNYGKKRELMVCFIFYIISFSLLFISSNFYILIIAFVFYGLGDAFRSGTHKAMIYSYLERKNWFMHKTYVYGRTRSFSLLGSSISAFISIIFVLNIPSLRWVFLLSILPYILDFILISSYPNYLDERRKNDFNFKYFFTESISSLKSIFLNKKLRNVLFSSSIYDAIFKLIKDYIQPILNILLISSIINESLNLDRILKIYLGIIYGIFYIFSSIASKNVYRISNKISSSKLMNISFDIMGILSFILFIFIKFKLTYLIILVFFLLYILKDSRRPIFVDVCGDIMKKNERATVMSVDSQIKSILVIILAPVFGFISDALNIEILFLIISVFMIILNRFLIIKEEI